MTVAQWVQAATQVIYEGLGYSQGRVADGDWSTDRGKGPFKGAFSFNSAHPFEGPTGDYDSSKKAIYKHSNKKDPNTGMKEVEKVEKVKGDEGKANVDPLNDEDKNPCIEHAYLHKTMMQGGGIEVEIIQEPDARYGKCYERQKIRQKREKLREFRFDFCVDQPSLKSSVQGRSGKRIFGN